MTVLRRSRAPAAGASRRLHPAAKPRPPGQGALSPNCVGRNFGNFPEHLAQLLSHALRIFAFEYRGKKVSVDALRVRSGDLKPLEHDPRMQYEKVASYRHCDPRIGLFAALFAGLLTNFSFLRRGKPVKIDAVRLVNLDQWSRYQYDSLIDNFTPITSACSARCLFCYRKGTLNGKLLGLSPRVLGLREAGTRAKYWQSDQGLGLPNHRADLGEPFCNRDIFDILDIARSCDSDKVFNLTTNGDYLDKDTIQRLEAYKPVVIALSVNSVDPAKRERMMLPRHAEQGIKAPALLRDAGIPFVGSIVADQRLDLADIERTIRRLDASEALMIRVLLPGYTRYSAEYSLPGMDQWWQDVAGLVQRIKETVESPILVSPALFWDKEITPRIEGLYRHSIARRAGLRLGDTVLEVNGHRVFTKMDVTRLLEKSYAAGKPCRLLIRRDDSVFEARLQPERGQDDNGCAEYERNIRNKQYGIFMNQGLEIDSLVWIKKHLGRLKKRTKALLFSTPLAQPHVACLLGYVKGFGRGHDVRLTIAEHDFWGGNIQVGDIHVVDDYVRHIGRIAQTGWKPDLAFIPDSFLAGRWGLDVVGNSYRRIEAETGVPTVLVPVTRIME